MSTVVNTPMPDANEANDVVKLHGCIQRELAEPHDGFEPVPFWMMITFGLLLFWGGMYMSAFDGEYRQDLYDTPHTQIASKPKLEEIPTTPDALKNAGARIYTNNCASCHQANGLGQPGQYPPLAESEWVAGVTSSPDRLARILLHGLNGPLNVNGKIYNNQMPAWGAQLKDHQIAAVLTFIRQEWGNKALLEATHKGQDFAILPKFITQIRGETAGRSLSWTEAELKAIPLKDANGNPIPASGSAAPAAPPAAMNKQ
ncbi:c-type cytochrome [Tuwongella immobilis]|uniref:Cytochrome c domain-containing protein n=1 Tax=Tuwongella immobilis TaxID=692036 RepID=A0A6C2YMH7_9BACT|nr:cytochrome c [Tuwongella immobilis]VIP02798.1 cytochrome c class i : Cytochrome c class I OS=Coraliomargarita akajimensis (strain DSM 45221 / IAM 15411 / JCM 23193 / KCTC 12865) GN=Caka_0027 PE=4 SV=1: Cytochrome_CBB3 [Tuwongella immobilis]VTS02482.1 cytochrome c class i : Cytochrome c class I OS=Coraliomargarita akajimensis (strain DSM 45221 / IAM 15411 / JCM 23193 / KCTC 12865) GN=Caka_0027 PE=4 SV=1: Cytochrome_CBB3 [Tuwongella immobilis]